MDFGTPLGKQAWQRRRQYRPDAGDIVWRDFTPQAGREQPGHRPAVVLNPSGYNGKTSLTLCCPMTTQIKSYPFEVRISGAVPSVVLSDQYQKHHDEYDSLSI